MPLPHARGLVPWLLQILWILTITDTEYHVLNFGRGSTSGLALQTLWPVASISLAGSLTASDFARLCLVRNAPPHTHMFKCLARREWHYKEGGLVGESVLVVGEL